MKLVVRRLAKIDLAEARDWYETRLPGLGDRLRNALDQTFDSIRNRPQIYRVLEGEVRRAGVPGFPYGVFFVVDPGVVRVIAILHNARDPRVWRGRT